MTIMTVIFNMTKLLCQSLLVESMSKLVVIIARVSANNENLYTRHYKRMLQVGDFGN